MWYSILIFLNLGLFALLGIMGFFYSRNLRDLKRLASIEDAETYVADCNKKADAAKEKYRTLADAYRNGQAKHESLRGNLKSLEQRFGVYESAVKLEKDLAGAKEELAELTETLGLASSIGELKNQVVYYQNFVAELKGQAGHLEESRDLAEFGYYTPTYDFTSSSEYQAHLDRVKDKQKKSLKDKTACACVTEWTVEGSKSKGTKMVNEQIKLMLRAFNGECDSSMSRVKFNNITSMEKRIAGSFDSINKLGATKQIFLEPEYLNLKLEELHLLYERQQRLQEEKEEQKAIRDAMREEAKAFKEIEKAKADAEKDEEVKRKALEQARLELMRQDSGNTAKMSELVERLENELKEVLDRKAKAIARAQLTRSGHVYVLSNIGALGEGVFKIGLTRRLDPQERVDELGSASVPFPFDVHAMIYSEDAPALERALHEQFNDHRVNLVNYRKEFFRASMDEIRAAVARLHGRITFVTSVEAQQYRETVAKRKSMVLVPARTA